MTSRLNSRGGRAGSQPLTQVGPPPPNLVIHALLQYSTMDIVKGCSTQERSGLAKKESPSVLSLCVCYSRGGKPPLYVAAMDWRDRKGDSILANNHIQRQDHLRALNLAARRKRHGKATQRFVHRTALHIVFCACALLSFRVFLSCSR